LASSRVGTNFKNAVGLLSNIQQTVIGKGNTSILKRPFVLNLRNPGRLLKKLIPSQPTGVESPKVSALVFSRQSSFGKKRDGGVTPPLRNSMTISEERKIL